jgi:hypothetical protein
MRRLHAELMKEFAGAAIGRRGLSNDRDVNAAHGGSVLAMLG